MDTKTILNHIKILPTSTRLFLLEDAWDEFMNEKHQIPLTQDQKEEIEKRLSEYESQPDDVMSPEEVNLRLQKQWK